MTISQMASAQLKRNPAAKALEERPSFSSASLRTRHKIRWGAPRRKTARRTSWDKENEKAVDCAYFAQPKPCLEFCPVEWYIGPKEDHDDRELSGRIA